MSVFGLSLVSTKELKRLQRQDTRVQSLLNIHRWFAGWRDLDIIWDYVFAETYYGSIGSCRDKYAEARGTNEYGRLKKTE